jgi:2-(1,2-epoxy-1,2-dihydrophenyl)acetyl-CoA isomerase
VIVERDGRIATITLNRPESLNALDPSLADALAAAFGEVINDASVRCVILTGAGGNFMSGGDVKFFRASLERLRDDSSGALEDLFGVVHGVIRAMRGAPQPIIAKVRGTVAGFGVSLMAACDLAFAAEDAVFTLAYTLIGATPDGASSYQLPRLIGVRRTMELALLNDRYDAESARAMGLVNKVFPQARLDEETAAVARRLAAGAAPAMAGAKRLINRSLDASLDEQLAAEEAAFKAAVKTADFAEGVAAFSEKRKPRFSCSPLSADTRPG